MYDDRLEITSPGGMPEGHLIQELDLNHVPSLRRNIIISDLFHRMHLMERRGSGITRILRAYERMGRKPLFYSESSYFTVMMPNVNYIDKRQNDSFDAVSYTHLDVYKRQPCKRRGSNASAARRRRSGPVIWRV